MKHEIEIDGLPEGWEAVAFRVPHKGDSIISYSGELQVVADVYHQPRLIIKKKQPRRIVLEETSFHNIPNGADQSLWYSIGNRWWRIVEDSGENND